jgi:hypothetical protein
MTDAMLPYSFIPGTKANAEEVNANFETLISAIKDTNEVFNEELQRIEDAKTDKTESAAGLETKADLDLENTEENIDYVVETWCSTDNKDWYRKYRSGWVEQGGLRTVTNDISSSFAVVINYFVPNIPLTIQFARQNHNANYHTVHPHIVSVTQTGFTISEWESSGVVQGARSYYWEVKGQGT